MPQLPDSADQQDVAFMQMALQLAAEAAAAGEVPVGAVLVRDGVVLGTGRNSPIESCDPSAHAEMLALRAAAQALGNYRLDDCTLYVTLEPCAMCCGAILHSRIQRVVFAASDPKTGCAGSVLDLFALPQLNHQTQVQSGLLAEQSAQALSRFFQDRRSQQRQAAQPLREDALRTPARCFADLPGYDWQPHYVADLPGLAGLRLHYLDEGPVDAADVLLCLHPVPGWSYHFRYLISASAQQGKRVLVPDLIGFGKSDKPKREAIHSPAFHARYLLELLECLDVKKVTLIADPAHPVAQLLLAGAPHRIQRLQGQTALPMEQDPAEKFAALDAPYPDAGHRAGERAFAAGIWHSAKMKP